MSQKKFKIDVALEYPVTVKDADGKDASRSNVTMHRPNTAHVKRLAVLLGADLLKAVLGSGDKAELEKIDAARLFLDIVDSIFTKDALDELTSIIASMCNETADFIDRLDPVDLMQLLKGMVDFFPALRSFASSSSAQTPPQASDGDQTT